MITIEEKREIAAVIRKVFNQIHERNKDRSPAELSSALLSLQDFLTVDSNEEGLFFDSDVADMNVELQG